MFLSRDMLIKLKEEYGTPLYIYSEAILREKCREVKGILPHRNVRINYSAKANTNPELLKIIHSEGLDVDAMSPGEIVIEERAGFTPDRIFFISNNVSAEEMRFAIDRGILISVDSLSQLELFGRINPGGQVAVRFNPGIGAGHHEKVVTAGKKTKFGIQKEFVPQVKAILEQYNLKLVGINQHIGSLFLDGEVYADSICALFDIAREFPQLQFIDFGGGLGVPYKPGENRLDFSVLGQKLDGLIEAFLRDFPNKDIIFKMEPGRYVVAECGLLLGTVHAVKQSYDTRYIGTDLGMNVLLRPAMYDAYHEVSIVKVGSEAEADDLETATIVGDICENSDILARDRRLPKASEGDLVVVSNAGAYGYVMASNYNCRLRPAEVLIDLEGRARLIRKRDTLEQLFINFV
jgi:diaminopimelate decarboxylase